jgi:atypical dual specificity phosphatase
LKRNQRPHLVVLFQAAACVFFATQIASCGEAKGPAMRMQNDPKKTALSAEERLVSPARGFSWIVPGKLAAMPVPGRNRSLDEDAAFIEQQGIRVLVSLTESPPEREVLAAHSVDQVHIPVQDFTAPTLEQMITFVAVVEGSSAAGKPVGVHCTAGLGRSGTMAAAYLAAKGSTAEKAIAAVRRLRPGSIETAEQEEAIRRFENHLAADR